MAKVLVISPTPSHPQNAGNRARIFALLSGLRRSGHQVGLIFVEMEEGDKVAMQTAWDFFGTVPYQRPHLRRSKRWYDGLALMFGSRKVAPYKIDDWFDNSLLPALADIGTRFMPDVVMVEYVYMSKAFEAFPDPVLKLLDTHDVMANRHHHLRASGLPPIWFYTTPQEEKKGLVRANFVLAIQQEEHRFFSELTSRPVITVGHIVPIEPMQRLDKVRDYRLLFVGSANLLNVDALHWFLDEVFPDIRRRCPQVCLEVIGDCAEKIKDSDGVLRVGYAEDVKPYYQGTTVVVNPIRVGTGLKIKMIEALAMGCAVVSTSIGCAGLEDGIAKAFCVADTAAEFADAVHGILIVPEKQKRLSLAAVSFAKKYNRLALQPLVELLEKNL